MKEAFLINNHCRNSRLLTFEKEECIINSVDSYVET